MMGLQGLQDKAKGHDLSTARRDRAAGTTLMNVSLTAYGFLNQSWDFILFFLQALS